MGGRLWWRDEAGLGYGRQVELGGETCGPNKCVSLCRRGECWLSVRDDASRRGKCWLSVHDDASQLARLFHWSDD
eukprot:1018396-Rhodomonas_salina.1